MGACADFFNSGPSAILQREEKRTHQVRPLIHSHNIPHTHREIRELLGISPIKIFGTEHMESLVNDYSRRQYMSGIDNRI